MNYTLTYKIGQTIKRVSLDETTAKAVQEKIANSDPQTFLRLGSEAVKVSQIQSVTADAAQNKSVTKRQLREALRSAAVACFKGPLRDQDGSCRGFFERPNGEMDICECQAAVKKAHGVVPRNFDYLCNEYDATQ